MKKIFISLLFVLPFLFSCQPQVEPFQPGEEDVAGCYGVYFPSQEATGSHTLDPTMAPQATFTAMRKNTNGAITVPLKVTASADGVFNVGELSFADGQSESTVTVTFPNSEIGTQYNLSLQIDGDQYVSKYNDQPIAIDYSCLRVEWVKFGHATFYQGWWGEEHTANIKYYEVNGIRTCVAECDEGNGIWGDDVNATIQFTWYTKNYNSDGFQLVAIPKQYFGFDYNDWTSKPVDQATYPIFLYDYYTYWIERGESLGTFLEFAAKYGDLDGSYPVSYYDGNGGFYFNARYYIPGLGGFSPDPFELVAIVDGYNRADYSIEIEAGESVNGVIPVDFNFTTDLTNVKYATFEGSLTPTQVENGANAIIEGTASGIASIQEAGTANITLPASGTYTVVAVGYNGTSVKSNASATFNYVAAGDEEKYAVKLFGGTEKTSALYEKDGLNDVNSFQFYLYGEELTDVRIGIFKAADVEDPNDVIDDLDPVSEKTLAQINGDGYIDIVINLAANTEYLLVAWGTNGYLSKVEAFPYTTNGLPLELVATGDYTYGIFFTGADPGLELYKNPNYENLYEIPNWGYGVSFQFYWNPETNVCEVVDQWVGYNHPSYGPVWVLETNQYSSKLSEEPSSYFDPVEKVFHFNVIYYVSAGSFGHDFETFTLTNVEGAAAAGTANVGLANSTFTYTGMMPAAHRSHFAGIRAERELRSVEMNVVNVVKKQANRELVKDIR